MEKRNNPTYVTENEVAKMTGLTLSTLRNWRFRRVGFPWIKVGRAIRYDLDDVLDFMNQRKIKTDQ